MVRVLSEAEIEDKVCRWAEKNGWLTPKLQSLSQTGWPDRTFIKNGKVVLIEFKKPGGRVSAKQKHWIKKLKEQNIPVIICEDVFVGMAFLVSEDPMYD